MAGAQRCPDTCRMAPTDIPGTRIAVPRVDGPPRVPRWKENVVVRRVLFVSLWLGGTLAAAAQDQVPPLAGASTTFRSTVEVVTLNVTVTDIEGRQVAGLKGDDFEVLEDGVRQEVRFFNAINIPLDVVLLIDTSSSMRGKIEMVQAAAREFVKKLRPSDRGAVVTFNSAVRVVQSFTEDAALLDGAINSARLGGGTALYTGIYVSLDHFSRLARREGELRKSAVVLLSDGEDTGSLIGEEDLLERARRAGVPIYPISVISESDRNALTLANQQRMRTGADFTLRTLARETGATAFFPMKLADLAGVYGQIAGELAAQYSVGYVPSAPTANGAFRRILVRIPTRPDAKPRTRAGYYATGPGRAAR
ncbi:MAG: VWA domain-containing protein [Acidobacteria bacterium]|nr:MAG: VWA domain-containing protein [Acidobacteriota bacterium]